MRRHDASEDYSKNRRVRVALQVGAVGMGQRRPSVKGAVGMGQRRPSVKLVNSVL
jgi:hypothetical protein